MMDIRVHTPPGRDTKDSLLDAASYGARPDGSCSLSALPCQTRSQCGRSRRARPGPNRNFAEIINSKDSVLLVISIDYSDYFQIIFRLFFDYFIIIIYDF